MSKKLFGNLSDNIQILILDLDKENANFLKMTLYTYEYRVLLFEQFVDLNEYIEQVGPGSNYLILADLNACIVSRHDYLIELTKKYPEIPIILMQNSDHFDLAVQTIQYGAYDFIKKPSTVPALLLAVERAINQQRLCFSNKILLQEVKNNLKIDQILGKSEKMQKVFDLIRYSSCAKATTLIIGESGTGKELIARAIHQNGPLKDKVFVAINCAAIPETLLESELFGHVKGAFTGASHNRKGLFQEADGGILFLDEIGDLSMGLQVKLLRVLQDKKIRPVGSNNYIQVDVQIIAATHKNLRVAIKKEQFREDLFYRLNVISISIPALRERDGDIIFLANYFLKKFSLLHHTQFKKFSKSAIDFLNIQKWPGNVRELENTIERATIISQNYLVDLEDLKSDEDQLPLQNYFKSNGASYLTLAEVERDYIYQVLKHTSGKKEVAANILNIDRTTLHRKLLEYDKSTSPVLSDEVSFEKMNGNASFSK